VPERGLGEPCKHGEVGVNPYAVDATGAERREAVPMLERSELALDGGPCPWRTSRLEAARVERVDQWRDVQGFIAARGLDLPGERQTRPGANGEVEFVSVKAS
jgi:hypothetical protein